MPGWNTKPRRKPRRKPRNKPRKPRRKPINSRFAKPRKYFF